MSDFFQDSHISAFHKLGNNMSIEQLEDIIRNFAPRRPIALVIPSLYSELSGEALPNILDKLKEVDYIQRIVVSLDRANKKEFEYAKKFFSRMPQKLDVIWNDGEKIQNILRILDENDIATGPQGKGRGAWMAFGYVLAKRDCYAIALHDADILTYERIDWPFRSSEINSETSMIMAATALRSYYHEWLERCGYSLKEIMAFL